MIKGQKKMEFPNGFYRMQAWKKVVDSNKVAVSAAFLKTVFKNFQWNKVYHKQQHEQQ